MFHMITLKQLFASVLLQNVLIGLMQLDTRCSDGSCQAQEDLIAGFSAIEALKRKQNSSRYA